MDKSLIWFLLPGILLLLYYIQSGFRHQRLNYDIEEYLLAGRRLPVFGFIIATTLLSLLGLMVLSHMGLIVRSGLSYATAALAAILMPATSALFAKRWWTLGTIYASLTPAQLLGDYYQSHGLKRLTTLIAVLIALCLVVMSLHLGPKLLSGLIGGFFPNMARGTGASITLENTALLFLAAMLFHHAALGGFGAVMRTAKWIGILVLPALMLAAGLSSNALGGLGGYLEQVKNAQTSALMEHLFRPGAFFDMRPSAAPANMAWPGLMVLTTLLAFVGLATSPAKLTMDFTALSSRNHGHQQFWGGAVGGGLILLTAGLMTGLYPLLSYSTDNIMAVFETGLEPVLIIERLWESPLGNPLVLSTICLAMLAGLISSSAAALSAAGGMIANDVFHARSKRMQSPYSRKSLAQLSIALLLVLSCLIAMAGRLASDPLDALPLFLLAGAFGLQLLPALVGLCYLPGLTKRPVLTGAIAGVVTVFLTSSIPQSTQLIQLLGWALPYGAWPYSVHPAAWGLGANITVLLATWLLASSNQEIKHQRTYHMLPDGAPIMASNAPIWRHLALILGLLWLGITTLALTQFAPSLSFLSPLPSQWGWQVLAWLLGLFLVYILAYRVQPVYDPMDHGTLAGDSYKRRFRIRATSRKAKPESDENNETRKDKK